MYSPPTPITIVDEPARLAALHACRILDSAPEMEFDDIARIAACIFGTPFAAISLIDEQRQWFKASVGLKYAESPRRDAFCNTTIHGNDVFVVHDAQADPHFADNPNVVGEPYIRFYAGAPLITAGGYALGSICVIDTVPRDVNADQLAMLRALARQVMDRIALRRSSAAQDEMLIEHVRLQSDFEEILAERDQAGAALRESEARLNSAFANAAVGASISDLRGRFLYVNAAMCVITGYSEPELLAMELPSLAHPDDVGKYVDTLARLRAGDIPSFTAEKRYIRKDGSIVWVKNSVSLGRDSQGRPEHSIALTEDITARKLADSVESQSRERTHQLLAVGEALGAALTTAQVAAVILDAAQPIFQASMVRACLLSSDESMLSTLHIVGTPSGLSPLWREVSIDSNVPLAIAVRERRLVVAAIDAERPDDTPENDNQAETSAMIRVGIPLVVAERCVGALGMICPVDRCRTEEQREFLWTLAGQCALALERARLYDAAQREIEEREKAEREKSALVEYNRLLLESTAEGIYGIDTAGLCTFINSAAMKLLGCTAEDVLGKNVHDLIHHTRSDGRQYPMEQCPIYSALCSGTGCQSDSEVLWRLDGTSFPASYASFPIRTESGIIGAVVTFSNITERKHAEQTREIALLEAQTRADCDPLTGLLNHRAFHRRLDEEADRAHREGTCFALVMLDLDNFKFFNDVYGHLLGDKVLLQVSERLRGICRSYDIIARFGGDEFSLLLPNVSPSSQIEIEQRLREQLSGIVCNPDAGSELSIPIQVSLGVALFPGDAVERGKALELADERLRRSKTGGGAEMAEAEGISLASFGSVEGFSMLNALVTAVDNKDRYTRSHSEDVMRYSVMIARELGWSAEQIKTVAIAALLHDVGKIGVPDAILRKPGKLTDAEYLAVQQHPMMGAALVSTALGLEHTLDAVRHHHERWDGKGYPHGLRGAETPLIARLMAVADAFSAMTTDRPYRKGMDRAKALALLNSGAGTQWDAECVNAFAKALATAKTRGECRQVALRAM